jgi:hypothetical protein
MGSRDENPEKKTGFALNMLFEGTKKKHQKGNGLEGCNF